MLIPDDPHDPMMFRYPEELQLEKMPVAPVWPLVLSGLTVICLLFLVI
jgi:hypothetical protein